MPYFNTTINYKMLDRLSFITNKRDSPQPEILENRMTVKWSLCNPRRFKSYVCFVFFDGDVLSFRNVIKRNWFERLLLKIW